MRTTPLILFGANGIRIRSDATFSVTAGGLQSFADVNDLALEVPQVAYATFEPDFWLLDGNYKFMADGASVGYISSDMSESDGAFNNPPTLTITFGNVYSTSGLKLYFMESTGDYADSVTIAFYNSSNVLIRQDTYTPTNTVFSTNQAVANFKKIEIYFNSTNNPFRYARLRGIDFDSLTRFTGTDVKAATLLEEINPLSLELPINTLELTLFSAGGNFSIVAPAGVYANLQYKDPLDAYEEVNGVSVYLGRFYLDQWESKTENEAVFHASDAIRLLDKTDFFVGYLYSMPTSDDVIDRIFTAVGLDYDLDASLVGIDIGTTFTNVFPLTSCRDALQNILFAIGGYATCSRSNIVQIKPFELASSLITFDHTITASQKGKGEPVQLRPLVTGVQVSSHDFNAIVNSAPGSDPELYNNTVGTGIIKLTFPDKARNYLRMGTFSGTITEETPYYIVQNVTVGGTMIIKESAYFPESQTIKTILNGSLPANTPANIISIKDAVCVRSYNIDTIAQRVYDYFQQRYLQKARLYGSMLTVGNSVLIATQSNRQIKGIVEKMETDLANGFVSKADIVGVVVPL
jgi:hypothetical protein